MNDTNTQSLDDFLGAQPEKPWRKWAIYGAVAVAVIVFVLVVRGILADDTPQFDTRPVARGDLTVTVSATGNLKPINQVDVGSEQSGLITRVYVDVNDPVTRGQQLAELDPSRLQDAVAQARAQVASAEAGIAQANAAAALSKATLSRQEEVSRLSGGRVPSKTELDTARANYSQSIAGQRSAEAQLLVARAQLSSAETNLSKARIVSPVTGVVLSRDIEPGQTVAASLNAPVLFTIAEDLKQMEVEVSVDEADVGQVKDGQPATFSVDAFPGRTFPAKVTRINVGSNASSGSSSSSTSTATASTVVAYTAVLNVDNSDETLRPGMTATADIVASRVEDVLLVPNAALRFNPSAQSGASGGGITSQLVMRPRRGGNAQKSVGFGAGSTQTIYVVGADGAPQAVEVVVGDSDGTNTAVLSGDIRPGMNVIVGQLVAGQEAPRQRGAGSGGGAGAEGGRRSAEKAGNGQ
ncbi:efflux RND transporter periplasmic adaptor subunit [Sphingosinicella soli]|uniref:HlyD family secretion protein n=1 Tax=Sphingosinicella soli TaxID=333708 RepID=A0A7W7B1L5_9SPHN|nr:efflux RND transporter periplasmic adaptor subunit [Sphingosinicella soli]MBB4632341.1 HlyD family secretion protein [Sphingosinicella soli]